LVLQGFADDSGSGRGATGGNIFVLAGFLSIAENWERFSDRWEDFSDQPPKTPDFHMKEAYRIKGPYRWKDETERDEKINGFVDLIKVHAMYRVGSILAWPNYDKVVKGRVPKLIDNPYFLLFFNVILSTIEFMDKAGLEGTVDWVFDEQGPIGAVALGWYYFIRDSVPSLRPRLGSAPKFKHDSQVLPLKAADLYAWQIRRYLDKDSPLGIQPNNYIESLLYLHGVSNVIEGEHMEDFVNSIGIALDLKSRTTYFLPLKEKP
jgi:hypothetical protein